MHASLRSPAIFWIVGFTFFLLAALSLSAGQVHAPESLVLSPTTIANDYVGALDLSITGLDNAGQIVVVEEFLDLDDSSTINSGDPLVRRFMVTDGQVTSIAGQRNRNIPGDEDGAANAALVTRLVYGATEIFGRADGRHIFRVSPSGTGFSPFTANLIVTQKDYGGSGISGTVMGGMPAVAQANAFVVVLQAGSDGDFVALTRSDASGNFSIKTAPGDYILLATKAGFIFDVGAAAPVAVGTGSFVTGRTLTLAPGGRTISGTVRDASLLTGLPAVMILAQSQAGFFSFTLSDASGNFVLHANSAPWLIQLNETGLARQGYLAVEFVESSPGSVTGFNLDLPAGTSLIHGQVKTPAGVGVPFVEVEGDTNGMPDYESSGTSDANGNYSVSVLPTSWRLNTHRPNFLGQEATVVVNTNGSAVLRDLTVYPITAHLRGEVRDNHNNLVPFLPLLARDPNVSGGGNEINSRTDSSASGAFDLGVFGGGGMMTRSWQLQISSGDGAQDYVGTSPIFNVQDGVDINGVTYLVYVVTAHLRGQVLDENDAPIGNIGIFANGGTNGEFLSGTDTDGGGNFDIGVFGGTWTLGLSNIEGLGLIPQQFSTTVQDGVDQNGLIFRARHATATISGTVMSASNSPIAGVDVFSTAVLNGATYQASATTNASGAYSLPVFSTNWTVGVNGSQLAAQGYAPVANQNVFVGGGTVTVNFVANPLATAVSRKLHGGTPFDLPLPLTGTSAVECRSGGATDDYQVVVSFGSAVTFTGASVSSGTGSVSSTSGGGTATVTINLTGVSNAQRLTILLAGVNNGSSTFDLSIPFAVLIGDTTGNGSVSGTDVGQTKAAAQSGAVNASTYRNDVNANGTVNASDIGLVKARSGTSLPPP